MQHKEELTIIERPRRRRKPRRRVLDGKKLSIGTYLQSWGLPPNFKRNQLRYKDPIEKGIYWYHLSRFVRERDVKKYGKCISCKRVITMDNCDAGHFMPASDCGRDLLFDLRNVNAECSYCNAWDSTHLLGYAEGLDERYGAGTAQELRFRREMYKRGRAIKDWTRKEYEEKIGEFYTRHDNLLPTV